jgi:hypothetical protein
LLVSMFAGKPRRLGETQFSTQKSGLGPFIAVDPTFILQYLTFLVMDSSNNRT